MAGALLGSSVAGFVVAPGYSTPDLVAKVLVEPAVPGLVGWVAVRRRAGPVLTPGR